MAKKTSQHELPKPVTIVSSRSRAENPLLKIEKTIRIAVSGDVLVSKLEREIVDTRDFQRLRGVRQLGTALMVYPTALHTRFDHSLGTLSMADRMMNNIRLNTHNEGEEGYIDATQEVIVRLYALLHDITHVPFGHTLEDELGVFARHDENLARLDRFLGPQSDIARLITGALGDEQYARLLGIYLYSDRPKEYSDATRNAFGHLIHNVAPDDVFIYDLVSNTVCADLLDYLARDSYFCNLGVGLEYRFLNFAYLGRDDHGKRRVFIRLWKRDKPTPRRDTLTDLGRLLESRYLLAERVYFHHSKIVTGAMLGRAVAELKIAGTLTETDLYDHSDDTLIRLLASSSTSTVRKLGAALRDRQLYETLFTFREDEFRASSVHDKSVNFLITGLRRVENPEKRISLENQLADEVGADPGEVLIYAPSFRIDSGSGEPKTMNLKVAEAKVLWEGEAKPLSAIYDELMTPRLKEIMKAHRLLWGFSVIVHRRLTELQRNRIKENCRAIFLSSGEEQRQLTIEYYEHLVDDRAREVCPGPIDGPDYVRVKRSAAEGLAASAHDDRRFGERIKDVKRVFDAALQK